MHVVSRNLVAQDEDNTMDNHHLKSETLPEEAYYWKITLPYITNNVLRNLLGAGIFSEFTISDESSVSVEECGEQSRREYEEEK